MTEWKPTEEQIEAACRAVLAAYGDPAAEWWDYRREVTAALVAAHEAGGGNAPTADPPNKIIASMKDAVSYAKGCGASASIRSMGRGSAHASTAEPAGDVKSSVAFLNEAARYFESRLTHGEDMAHWANARNAENCRKIAAHLTSLSVEVERLNAECAASMLVIAEERARAEEAEAECDNLKHDIARYVEIASEHATEVERLRGLLEEIADLESYTRVGGATVGDLGSYEAGLNEALELARAALKGDGNG